jgi:hypothetical protein
VDGEVTALAALVAGALLAMPMKKPVPHFVKKVDVGGYKLAISCEGKGSPVVVLDSGFSTPRSAWYWVTPRLRATTRVCSYDRAGLGESQDRPAGITPTTAEIMGELHTLLQRAKLTGPFVLGGWSIGGFDIRYYQHRYPGDVAGMVLVDGTTPAFLLASPDPITSAFETMYTHEAAHELALPPPLGALPVVDITHGVPLDEGEDVWVQGQRQVTSSTSNSIFLKAKDSGHGIPDDDPGLVAYGLKLVVKSVRTQRPMPACASTRAARYRGICLDPR